MGNSVFNILIERVITMPLSGSTAKTVLVMADNNKDVLTKREFGFLKKISSEIKHNTELSIRRPSQAKTIKECIVFVTGGKYDAHEKEAEALLNRKANGPK